MLKSTRLNCSAGFRSHFRYERRRRSGTQFDYRTAEIQRPAHHYCSRIGSNLRWRGGSEGMIASKNSKQPFFKLDFENWALLKEWSNCWSEMEDVINQIYRCVARISVHDFEKFIFMFLFSSINFDISIHRHMYGMAGMLTRRWLEFSHFFYYLGTNS